MPRNHLRKHPRASLLTAVVIGMITAIGLSGCTPPASYTGEAAPHRDVGVQLFQWTWDSIAHECTTTLGPAGIAWVLTSPPQEHILGSAWWTAYQPVSYAIESRLGTREQFAEMVTTCHDAGVAVIADAVINHMTGQDGGGIGWAGTEYGHYDYPGLYSLAEGDFHNCAADGGSGDITNYSDADHVQSCELVNLADLDTAAESVRSTIATYLNDLRSLGVDGFRIDAAKHMPAADVQAIVERIDGDPYIISEVIRGDGEPIQPEEYVGSGDVFEFGLAYQLKTWMTTGQLSSIRNANSYGFLDSAAARTFVDNHDTERNRQTLSYRDGAKYQLATVLLLSSDYGSPVLYSGYSFTLNDLGLPHDPATGRVTEVECSEVVEPGAYYADGEWVCQHRWTGIMGMVAWRAATHGQPVTMEWEGDRAYAFSRGTAGFVAMNADETPLSRVFATGLPAGDYCDDITGVCGLEVAADGSLEVTVPAWGAVAIHVPSP